MLHEALVALALCAAPAIGPEEALALLDEGHAPDAVAERAGCPDVPTLEAWLGFETEEFALVRARFPPTADGIERSATTPLPVEENGFGPVRALSFSFLIPGLGTRPPLLPDLAVAERRPSGWAWEPWEHGWALGPRGATDPYSTHISRRASVRPEPPRPVSRRDLTPRTVGPAGGPADRASLPAPPRPDFGTHRTTPFDKRAPVERD